MTGIGNEATGKSQSLLYILMGIDPRVCSFVCFVFFMSAAFFLPVPSQRTRFWEMCLFTCLLRVWYHSQYFT